MSNNPHRSSLREEMFPQLDAFDDSEFHVFGYHPLRISVFDHWLSEEEAASCCHISYAVALKNNCLDDYLQGEHKFLDFYEALATSGVFAVINDGIREFNLACEEFKRLVTNSLRESQMMDVYVKSINARAIGGFDRTDLLLLEEKSRLDVIRVLVSDCGLFILP